VTWKYIYIFKLQLISLEVLANIVGHKDIICLRLTKINNFNPHKHSCHYVECRVIVILSVVMLSVVMLSVVMLNVVAPFLSWREKCEMKFFLIRSKLKKKRIEASNLTCCSGCTTSLRSDSTSVSTKVHWSTASQLPDEKVEPKRSSRN